MFIDSDASQAQVKTQTGKGQRDPGPLAHRSNSVGYLMGRLLRKDADIAEKIGKGKQFRSINAAAQHHNLIPKRKRYEINPEVNLSNAVNRLVEVLGREKAAELAARLTQFISESNGSN